MSSEIVIVNFGMGNLNSVRRMLERIKCNAVISSKPQHILGSRKLILPGVGHFAKAMTNLKEMNLIDALNEAVLVKQTPILGICLGMQLMAQKSEEGDAQGLGWFDADVRRFVISDKAKYKVPHIGWNQVSIKKKSPLMFNISESSEFYFVHSYHVNSNDKSDILNETQYDYVFTSAVAKDNIFGVQYHPEKSHDAGAQILKNFINL